MSVHPTLFGAVPIGCGRGDVESLTGFFARLCLSRFVKATRVVRAFVLDRCPSDLLPSHPLRVGNFLSRHSSRLDLQSDSALPFATALEDLTGISDLHRLSFSACVPLLDLGSLRYLGRHRKRWCPACLAASVSDGSPPHEPLLWRFALVERCPIHRLELLDRCPVCARFQPLITQGVPVGHCVYCGHVLHQGASLSPPEEASLGLSKIWALWRSVALSRLLAWTSALDRDVLDSLSHSSRAFSRLLEYALDCPPDPSIRSPLALACALGLSTSHMSRLLSGALRPSLSGFLDTCMQLGVDPLRVVRGEICDGERSWPPSDSAALPPCGDSWRFALEVRESCMVNRYSARARALDEFIADSRAVDLDGLIRTHRTHPFSLSRAFPLRYARARTVRGERLSRRRQAISQRYDAVLDRALSSDAIPSLTQLAASLGITQTTLAVYSPERCARIVALRESSYSTRESGLADRVRAALLAALDEPEGPTVHEVARSLGVEDFAVMSVCPDEYRLLVDLRDRERNSRYARYAAAMREDLARSRPRGVTWVADRLGVCFATLRRADPSLHAKLVALPSDRAAALRRRRNEAVRVRAESLSLQRSKLAAALDRELAANAPRSPRAVALECGVPPSVLSHHCPDTYQQLLDLRNAARCELLATVRRALEAEISVSAPRPPTTLAADLDVGRSILVSSFPSLVAELRAAVKRAPRRPLPRRSRPGDSRLLAALHAEAQSPTPRSVRALARALKTSPSILSRVSRDSVERLIAVCEEHRRRQDAELRARVVSALEADLRSSRPRAAFAVVRILGLSDSVAARLAPGLYRQLVNRCLRSG